MRIYVAFDDTDMLDCGRGTGRLARWFEDELPSECELWAVVRQQLLVHPSIPYTSHNSSAVVVLDAPSDGVVPDLIESAIAHVEKHMIEGSDPGVCVAAENDPEKLERLIRFGQRAAVEVVTKADALDAASGVHLSEHGGTGDGIIGAAAGVGLTAGGWSGRMIEYAPARLRGFPEITTVAELQQGGIFVMPIDKDGASPLPSQAVDTLNWVRPRLLGGRPVVPVVAVDKENGDRRADWIVTGRRERKPAGS